MPEVGDFAWTAEESSVIRAMSQLLCDERGVEKSRIRASSYWKRRRRRPRNHRRIGPPDGRPCEIPLADLQDADALARSISDVAAVQIIRPPSS
jgi:Siderophore-interacting protein